MANHRVLKKTFNTTPLSCFRSLSCLRRHALGAPNKPSADELAKLKAASAAGVVPVAASALVKVNATATTVTLELTENSAVVVEYIV